MIVSEKTVFSKKVSITFDDEKEYEKFILLIKDAADEHIDEDESNFFEELYKALNPF